ncbi:serine--tRNA ligase [Patescibacteria group bacterium]|nr:serine--tRNA ligase [Patescibacteria group bacterium]MBU1256324.1 serine--tRNA ligase [Patescibacteria group bacterium]MBU1457082.1 serine--tRNA ligase [Patescibacteria group bacterium]
MLDINFIRENKKKVETACTNKGLNPKVVGNLLEIDIKRRQLMGTVQVLRAQRNTLNDKLKQKRTDDLLKKAAEQKKALQDIEPQLKQTETEFGQLMLQVPNVPLDDVPIGKDESGNRQVKTWGEKPRFDFKPKNHIELGTNLNMLDLERGSKVAGFRGYYLKNDAVLMQNALMQFALKKFVEKGYTPIIPPVITKRQTFINSGHFPWGESEAYKLASDETDPDNEYFLSGTAEVPLVSMYAGETFKEKDLPIKMVGYSPCYRREIGNYGKDTKGFYRVHEFTKIEQVVICKNDLNESIKWHEKMLEFSEEILQDLGLHYQVMLMCTGDMGEPQAKKYDLETWMPGRNSYGETGSDSIMTDFQARRANIKYVTSKGETKFVHMLNNTALPSVRALIAVWETYQQEDGSIKVPPVLVPYMGKEVINGENKVK